jgi:Protein of unknown function (DUF1573)
VNNVATLRTNPFCRWNYVWASKVLLLAAISVACGFVLYNILKARDIVSIIPPAFNFGTVLQSQTIRHDFGLFNKGRQVLSVFAVGSDCACTVVRDGLLGKTVRPGGILKFPVEYSVGDKKGFVSGTVSLFLCATNATDHLYEVRAHMEGYVLPEFVVEPNSLDFGTLKPGEQSSKTVTFLPQNARNLAILAPVSAVEAFQVSLSRTNPTLSQPTWTATITFRAPPNATRREMLSEVVRFKTSSQRAPEACVYVVGRVSPDVEIIPDTIILPSLGLCPDAQMELTIRTDQPSRVTRLTAQALTAPSITEGTNGVPVPSGWNGIHCLRIPNTLLAQSDGVNVELQVRNGADRMGARSVFVPIKRLRSQ